MTGAGMQMQAAGGGHVAYADFKNSAFPYRGAIPADTDNNGQSRPFLDVSVDGRLAHSSPRGGTLWEDTTYNDRRVLFAAGADFDPNRSGVIIVYFHGNQTILARDVVDRQQTVRQLAQSNLNAVMVAPQLAVDAQDSSAGNFWRPGAFAQFLDEAETKLGELYPNAGRAAFRRMPVIVVAYSGGYMPAAYSLVQGGAGDRIRGVILLDALYGESDKFARWIESAHGGAFFISAFSSSSHDQNAALRDQLQRDGVRVDNGLPDALRAGVVAFVDSGDVKHEDFVNVAWTNDPLTDVLSRVDR
ncbi:MAG: alpha/beta hydrolase [Bradyrhizobium sp.]|nr:MAG: alpha/beta hydrolase [Bradyrhizobium sp.]